MAKKPKGEGRRASPKTKSTAPGAPSPGDNLDGRTDDEVRALFLDHRRAWNGWKAKLAVVEGIERDVKAALKADGYTVKQMQIADQLLGNPKSEAKVQAEVKDRLQVARWIGHKMGNQLDLFAQPDRTPAVDTAYDAGKQASMENQPRKPPHAPETEQSRRWFEGYDAHQSELHGKVGRGKLSEELAKNAEAGREVVREFEEQAASGTVQ